MAQNRRYIIAKSDDGNILGFAGIIVNPDITEIMNIVVRKSYRQQGVGQKLLEELIRLAKKTGLETLDLEVNAMNFPAIHLYEKNGFEIIGRRSKYYHNINDAILMQKLL